MPDSNTKKRILNASIKLFNNNGMANVKLQQIAQEIGISPGNLAYHFRNKEAIVAAINEELYQESLEILASYRVFPNLLDFEIQLNKYLNFVEKYPFYFLDVLEIERYYPTIKSKRQLQILKMINQIRQRFDYNYKRGLIHEEPHSGVYDGLTSTIWVLITSWVPQNMVRGAVSPRDFKKFKQTVWNQMYPYFTDIGRKEFERLIRPLLI